MATRSAGVAGLSRRSASSWGWLAASGVIGILVGVVALFFPGLTLLSAAVLLGLGLVVQGVVEIVAGLRGGTAGRGWLIAFGVLALVAGVLVLFVPGTGLFVLAWGVVLWFLVAGINDLVAAAGSREHRVGNVVVGVISLLAAVLLLFSPGTAVGVLALFIALGFLVRGGATLGLALAMRSARR